MEEMSKGLPQFTIAEFAPNGPTMTCAVCGLPVEGPYCQIGGANTCAQCTHKVQAQAPSSPRMNFSKAIGVLALLGSASPFLDLQDPVHGVIGLVILFVGIRFAWRFTAGRTLAVSGPYSPTPAGVI